MKNPCLILLLASLPVAGLSSSAALPSTNSLKTVLRFAGPDGTQIGQPIHISVFATNTETIPQQYDPSEVGSYDDFIVTGPDGAVVPYVGGGVQRVSGFRTLEPHKEAILAENVDLSDKYLLSRPGDYKAYFRGSKPHPVLARLGKQYAELRPSNEIVFTLKEGTLSNADRLAAQIVPIRLKGWFMGKSDRATKRVTPFGRKSVPGVFVYLSDGYKAHNVWVWCASEEAPEAPGEEHPGTSDYLGFSGQRHYYVSIGDPTAWSDAKASLVSALLEARR